MIEIADLIQRAREEPTTDNLRAMWHKVFALPVWYLLPAAEGPTMPLVLQAEDGAWVVAFTHFRPLNEFARAHGLRNDAGEVPMLPMPPAEALDRLEEVAEHVRGVVFNPATELTFRSTVDALRLLRAELLQPVPPV